LFDEIGQLVYQLFPLEGVHGSPLGPEGKGKVDISLIGLANLESKFCLTLGDLKITETDVGFYSRSLFDEN
jgi:hypothetical protein